MTEREAKAFLNNLKVCIEEHPIVADWLVEIADRKTENSSEKPNNCEHITEDGVTCAKYPACDDCLDNPLSKVKGSERLVKGSEQTEPTISKMEQVDEPQAKYPCDTCANKGDHDGECSNCVSDSEVIKWKTPSHYKPKDEPQTCNTCKYGEDKHRYAHICNECGVGINNYEPKDEPQTIRCPKCGRSDYIREFGKDFSVTAEEAGFKYKCINCNTYIEPQTDCAWK